MNKQRREALDKVHTKFMNIVDLLEQANNELEDIQSEEQDALDNMPESLWNSERYERMEEIANTLEEQTYEVANAIDAIENVLGELWDIIDEGGARC